MNPVGCRGVLCTPLRVEHAALKGTTMRLLRTGMGPRRAARTAALLSPTDPVLVAGLAAAQSPHIHPGDVVVATEIHPADPPTALSLPNLTAELFDQASGTLLLSSGGAERSGKPGGIVEIPSAVLLAGALRRLGLTVHVGPIASVARIVWGAVEDGALAVDMESAQLAPAQAPFAVVRAIVDTPEHPLWHIGTVRRGITALRSLKACRPALEWWAAATGPRQVLHPAPSAPRTDDICYATTDHQRAVRAVARQVDLVLVVGSPNSSNSVRLLEVAQREGVPAYLVEDATEIDLRWLAGRPRLGITGGASAPPHLVDEIVHCLSGLGPLRVSESQLIDEAATIAAPKEVI